MGTAYKKLAKKAALELKVSDLVYITLPTAKDPALIRVPAFVSGIDCRWLHVVYCGHNSRMISDLMFGVYGDTWYLEVVNGFTVDTPAGTLHVWDKDDSEYPGVMIDLYPDGFSEDAESITLAMTEYIPGGEGLCGWDPSRPWLSQQEIDEVPVERIVDGDGRPIKDKSQVTMNSKHTVTAGLVTRTWPDEVGDQDYHKRTFHIVHTRS